MSGEISCKRCRRLFEHGAGPAHPRAPARCPYCAFTFRPGAVPVDGGHLALRPDLTVEPVEENETPYFVIKDPVDNRFFRVKPLEHFLISQFDGATPLETIRRRASEEKRVLVSQEVLSRFAQKFHELGLLVDATVPGEAKKTATRWTNVLSIRFPLANPERLLDWLYPKFRFCFGASFVLAASLTTLAACLVAILNHDALAFGVASAVSLEGLVFVLATLAGVTVLHELAHGLTCRHFGGRVTDMGFLLLYFLPCFYCNVSDTYLFREKRQRLWVFFAGGFFELFVWASAVLAWRMVVAGTFLSRVLFVVVAVCGVRSLFNFNPLIKMDGYFMLSDWLGISNLRKEALDAFERLVRRIAGLGATPARQELRDRRILALPGDRFLALFGGTAIAYTLLLVGAIVLYSGGFVFTNFGTEALAIFSIGLVGLLHKPAFTAASAAKEAGREKWETLGQQKKRPRFLLIWGGLALLVAFFPWPLRVGSELEVFPRERWTQRAPTEGRIGRIHVTEGASVNEGDLLLEYDATELRLARQKKEAELNEAKEALLLIEKKSPISQAEVMVAARALETAKTQETSAERVFQQNQELWTNALISQNQLDGSKDDLEEARARVSQAQAAYALAVKQSLEGRQEDQAVDGRGPEVQRRRIEGLEAELSTLDDRLSRTKIYAEISGTVTTYRFEEKVGNYLEEGDEVCEIVNDASVVIEMRVPEKDIDIVESGQRVKFKVRGYPARSFEASVDEISPVAERGEDATTILIRSYVDNRDKILRPGMTGVAKIYSGLSVVGHILTRDIVRFIRTEFWL